MLVMAHLGFCISSCFAANPLKNFFLQCFFCMCLIFNFSPQHTMNDMCNGMEQEVCLPLEMVPYTLHRLYGICYFMKF